MVWKMTCRLSPKGRNLSLRCTPALAFSQMWFSRRYRRADVLDQCFRWKDRLLELQKMSARLIRFEPCRVQIKQCFTYESLQRIGAYLGQTTLNLARIRPNFKSLTSFESFLCQACWKSALCFWDQHEIHCCSTLLCCEYFWLSAAKVWTQPFIILSQGKQLASFFQTHSMGYRPVHAVVWFARRIALFPSSSSFSEHQSQKGLDQ